MNHRWVHIVDPVCHCPMHMRIARVGCIAGNIAAVPIDAVAVHSAWKLSTRPLGLFVVSFAQHQRTLEILEGAVAGYVFEPDRVHQSTSARVGDGKLATAVLGRGPGRA